MENKIDYQKVIIAQGAIQKTDKPLSDESLLSRLLSILTPNPTYDEIFAWLNGYVEGGDQNVKSK